MKSPFPARKNIAAVIAAASLISPALAQETKPAANTAATEAHQPTEAEMMEAMMEMAKVNENHKLLSRMDGDWDYTVKFWVAGPDAKPAESKGTATRKSIMGGRFTLMNVSGKMQMPGEDGKLKDFEFNGQGIDGYDNARKKFVNSWIDNMGTGVMMAEGDYNAGSNTFTYTSEYQAMPTVKQKVRETLQVTDKDHMVFTMFENHGGTEVKTTEIAYTRKK